MGYLSLSSGPVSVFSVSVNAGEITVVLQQIEQGDTQAADRLLPLVYKQLRHLAAMRMAREAAGQTLQPTALVHEAWLRLGGDRQPDWKSRAQFFAAAAEAMRRILIDRARRRLAQRRGGRQEHLNLDEIELAGAVDDERVLAVNEALEKFAIDQPQKAELVKLRFFGGVSSAASPSRRRGSRSASPCRRPTGGGPTPARGSSRR